MPHNGSDQVEARLLPETAKSASGQARHPEVWHPKKPDLDNLIKAVTDAITDTQRVWLDDSQIYEITATKTYALQFSGCAVRIEF